MAKIVFVVSEKKNLSQNNNLKHRFKKVKIAFKTEQQLL